MNNDDFFKSLDLLNLDIKEVDLDLPDIDLDLPSVETESSLSTKDLESITINKEDNCINVKFKDIESFINAHGADNINLLEKSIKDLINYHSHYSNTASEIEENTNFDLSVMDNLKPKDPLEAIMLKQILMTHSVINKCFINSVLKDQTTTGKDLNINRTTKLIRAFNSQIQAYIKYSRGGHQKVTVQHVNVSDGGQAIVGDVSKK